MDQPNNSSQGPRTNQWAPPSNPTLMSVMRSLLSLLAVFFLLIPPAQAQNLQEVYNEAVNLYKEKQYAEALVLFDAVLKAKPGFVYARNYASKCRTALSANLTPKNDLEGKLAKVTLPLVEFNAAPIGDVLQFLSTRAGEISKGTVSPNFIYKGTPEQRDSTLVSLNLRNVPMTEVLRYIGQLTRTKFIYEEHAVVADPNYYAKLDEAAKEAAEAEAKEPDPVFGSPAKDIFE